MADQATAPQAQSAFGQNRNPQGQQGQQGQGQGNRRSQRRDDRPQEEKQFDERTLHIDRVARVVKGGRRFRFRALVVVGDRKNKVGIGMAKGADVTAAITKATEVAKKHMITVSLYKGTLPHEVETKVSGAHILLKPASAGTGLIAGGVIRTILDVAGVKNALSKSLGSSNKANTAYATINALDSVVPASQWVTAPTKTAHKSAPKAALKPVVKAATKPSGETAKKPVNKESVKA